MLENKRRQAKDYWAQINRTVRGKPVEEDQIQMIVGSILAGLQIQPGDTLLDLCCGNGALTDRIFQHCRGGLGVDISEPFIAVAKSDFEVPGERSYRLQDATEFVETEASAEPYTKALCYGAFMYLPVETAERFLKALRRRFPNIERVMIGNLPDKARLHTFFDPALYRPGVEDDPTAATGIWRTEEEFADLARRCGWDCAFARLPPPFYAAHYRHDAVLSQAAGWS